MTFEVVVCSIVNPFKLAPAERSLVLDIFRVDRIMCPFLVFMLSEAEINFLHSQGHIPIEPGLFPHFEESVSLFCIGLDKVLKLHLFELPRTEGEVTGGNFISERLTDLGDAERDFYSGRINHVLEVYKHSLGYLSPKIGFLFRLRCP